MRSRTCSSRREVLAAAALALGLTPAALRAQGTAPTKKIFMILWRGETEVETGFRAELARLGLPVEILSQSVDLDLGKLPAVLEAVRAAKPDLVTTWGTPLTLAVAGTHDDRSGPAAIADLPVVFTMVTYPVESGVVASMSGSKRNVTGVSHTVPVPTQVQAMQAYMPVDRIAALFTPTEENAVLTIKALEQAAQQAGIALTALPVPLTADGKPDPAALPALVAEAARANPQFLYLGPDSFLAANREPIMSAAMAASLPTFSATEVWMRQSRALFGLVSPYADIGALAARKAHQILAEGKPPGDLPIETLQNFSYLLNMSVARELQVMPDMALLDYAEVLE